MLKFLSILPFSREKEMVSIKAFLNIIQRTTHGDIQVSKASDAQFLKIGKEIMHKIK